LRQAPALEAADPRLHRSRHDPRGRPQLGPGGTLSGRGLVLLPGVAALMLAVGLLAALGPARRGLAVEPTQAMREE
jgi:hypothetical protein